MYLRKIYNKTSSSLPRIQIQERSQDMYPFHTPMRTHPWGLVGILVDPQISVKISFYGINGCLLFFIVITSCRCGLVLGALLVDIMSRCPYFTKSCPKLERLESLE